jgi:DNA-binding MarR family transcriptional regulator
MKAELDIAFAKLMNPRMSSGLLILYRLLSPLKGTSVTPTEVRKSVNEMLRNRKISKQSITNAARRLEEASIINREEGYAANYGYLISVLLDAVMRLTTRVDELEEEIEEIKTSSSNLS